MLAEDGSRTFDGEGVVAFPDSDDSSRWYYASTRPALVPGTFTLLGLQPPPRDAAGSVALAVDLAVSDAAKERVADALGAAQLTPIPWADGTATLALASGDATQTVRPTLLGDNRAYFTVPLTIAGFTVVQAALCAGTDTSPCPEIDGPAGPPPIAVSYDLRYAARTTALDCSVTVDWDAWDRYMRTACGAKLLFINVSVENVSETLERNGIISINWSGEGDDRIAAGVRATQLLLDTLLERRPAFTPPDDGNGGGWGFGLVCSARTFDQSIRQHLEFTFSTTIARSRSMHPQGLLDGLAQAYTDRGATYLSASPGDTVTRTLQVLCNVDMAGDDIDGIDVIVLDSGGAPSDHARPSPVALTPVTPEGCVRISYDAGWPPAFRYTVRFSDPARRAITSKALPITREATVLLVSPHDCYSTRRVTVSASPATPWRLLRSVSAAVTLVGGEPRTAKLTEAAPTAVVDVFSPTADAETFSTTTRWTTTTGDLLSGPSQSDLPGTSATIAPPASRRTQLVASGWDALRAVDVLLTGSTLLLTDGTPGTKLTLTEDAPRATVTAYLPDSKPVTYLATYHYRDGTDSTARGPLTGPHVVLAPPERSQASPT